MAFSELSTGLQIANNSYIPAIAYANLPAAAASNGKVFSLSDFGGIVVTSNGTNWKPILGSAIIYQSGVITTTTSSASETNLATVTIPAGLVSANGALRITSQIGATGTANTKTPTVRHNTTSGAVTGGTQLYNNQLSSSQLSAAIIRTIWNRNATNSQISANNGSPGSGNSTNGSVTGAIDMTAASYLNFNGTTASGSDAVYYDAITVEWIEK